MEVLKKGEEKAMEDRFRASISRVIDELGPDAFACWFDCGANENNLAPEIEDAEYAFRTGFEGFIYSVMRPPVPHYLPNPEEKTALEIGYGGGRLLHAAAHLFKEVIGVDIHTHSEYVRKMLAERGVDNATLFETDGDTLPVAEGTVDFVYSFVVFIHLSSPQVLERYIAETYRVLKPGGIASLYYGRPYAHRIKVSQSAWKKHLYWHAAPWAELVFLDLLGDGYRSIPDAPANSISLMVSRRKMRKLVRQHGFEILSQQRRKAWSQGFLVLRKPV